MNEKHEHNVDRVWDIIEKVGVTMLTTQFSGGLRARPLEARPGRDAGLIWFVTDVRSGKEHDIEAEHDACLVFIDAEAKAYLSITARAEVRRDHAKAAEIWKSTDNMWWSGPVDPNVCVLRCDRSLPSFGTDRRARLWPRSKLPRRGSPAPSRISARTARSP
jgi:general stress protein 26